MKAAGVRWDFPTFPGLRSGTAWVDVTDKSSQGWGAELDTEHMAHFITSTGVR